MIYEGVTTKMQTEWNQPIAYYMVWDHSFLSMNEVIGQRLQLERVGYQCLQCGKPKKIFRQGFCYDCSMSSAHAGDWILRPELSTAHLGIEDRDLSYEQKVQLQPHTVYLAVSSEVKVGVTRNSQIPTRWIDQGASAAIAVVEVPNRYLAGIAEVALKSNYVDKTHWQKMVKNEIIHVDLLAEREQALLHLPEECMPFVAQQAPDPIELNYPTLRYPTKVQSVNLEKTPSFADVLIGIKGQYLLFESGAVCNVRSHEGFVLRWTIG
ncbi:MAG: hypothetical protein CFE24_11950 [Flavobacterium sp. BFFFF2]|nr:MAG: hypothetical protein CFE24_11950 [Flavobacterium sp. BFFFF2]